MNSDHGYARYVERAEAATGPTERTVAMLGMMCAGAVNYGGLVAFVGRGIGGNWPDPREGLAIDPDDFDRRNIGYGVNFPAPGQPRRKGPLPLP